jgi:hypothetical protein
MMTEVSLQGPRPFIPRRHPGLHRATPAKLADLTYNYGFDAFVLYSGTEGTGSTVGTTDLVYRATYTPAYINYNIAYSFVSGTSGMTTLPTGVLSQCPAAGTGHNGQTFTPGTSFTGVDVTESGYTVGTWSFQTWDAESKTINGAGIGFTRHLDLHRGHEITA